MPIPNSQKRVQFFIRTHNEAHPVTAMRVCNPDVSSLKIEGSKPSSNSYQ